MEKSLIVRIAEALSPVARTARLIAAVSVVGLFAAACTDTTDPGVLSTLVVSPNPATVAAGATVQFKATGTDFTGASVTPNPGSVVWSVAAGGGTINSSTGLFTASTKPGTYTNTIVATCRGITASATVIVTAGPLTTITVTPNPVTLAIRTTQQFTAVGTDAFGNVVAITPVWTTTNPPGTINASTGLFTAGDTPGTYANSVKATQGTISGTATVTVTTGALVTITVTPNPATLPIRTTQQFTAVGKDAAGNVVAITPVWTTTNPPGTINASTGLFTSGDTPGTYNNSVTATQGTVSGSATVIVTVGPVSTITVTPNPATLQTGAQQQFTAVGKDAAGNVVAITPVWTTTNPPGTINSSTGLFTAGNTTGTFTNAVTATSGGKSGSATVIVTAPTVPASTFRVVSRVAVTCTNGTIAGDVGTNQSAAEVPPGSITQTICPITGGTAQVGTTAAKQAYSNFLTAYAANDAVACGTTLTGTLAGVTLAPGVYCFDGSATVTGTLTLSGTGAFLFKVGTSGTGALTGNLFTVTLAGGASACNVTWLVRDGVAMTDSNFKGTILAGAGVTFTNGTFKGSASSKQDVTITGTPATACDAP